MFDRIGRGWELTKASWRVLLLDKELLVFPLISGLACILVFASFAVPLFSSGYLETVADEEVAGQNPVAYVILFAFYFANYFVIVFFNAALIGCAIIRFKGGDPTVADGFRAAGARLPQIIAWALVSATVGLILRVIESRSERAGQFVAGLMGMAWSAVTYFVVPVIVIEKAGPIDATKRSLAILKRSWGEALTANFGIGLIVFLVSLVGMLPIMLGVFLLVNEMVALGIAALVFGVLLLITISLISSALNAIVIGALYLYAAEGTVPQQFSGDQLRGAFGSR